MNKCKPVDAPSFAYRGGKARLRTFIVRFLPLHGKIYVEPFAGRGNVFFLIKQIGNFEKWHLNDLQTMYFFEAIKRYDGQPLPEITKEIAKSAKLSGLSDPHIWLEPLIYWAGGIAMKSSATGSRGHDLIQYSKTLLQAKRDLQQVEMTSNDALKVIEQYFQNPEAVLYIDPPYLNSNVGSYHEDQLDRDKLISLLKLAKCKWVLSEYRCNDLISAFGEPDGVLKNVFVAPTPSGNTKRVSECVWRNFTAPVNIIDFEKSIMPFKASLDIVNLHHPISFEEFSKLSPAHWAIGTKKAQYNRCCSLPYAFYDGETVSLLEEATGSEGRLLKVTNEDGKFRFFK